MDFDLKDLIKDALEVSMDYFKADFEVSYQINLLRNSFLTINLLLLIVCTRI